MKTLILTMFALVLLFCTSKCRDEEDALPAETYIGYDTFGCLVNGEVWINKGHDHFAAPNTGMDVYSDQFKIVASKTTNLIRQFVIIEIKKPLKETVYFLNSLQCQAYFGDEINNCFYKTDTVQYSGKLEITKIDSINYIVAGRFSFKASKYINVLYTINGQCDSSVTITDGRFNIEYIY